jgi:phosphoribosyl 1,2-cyclic phosphate phosphodiesterase
VPHFFESIDISGQFILLGTGTSVGVPTIGCGCPVCKSTNPRNKRTRTAAIAGLPAGNLLIDTPPDLHSQLIREGIGIVHAVVYTHDHADHLFGLDDLRLFPFRLGGPVPLYCERTVEDRIRHSYDYAFSSDQQTHAGAIPSLEIRSIGVEPFEALGARIQPLRLLHGPRFQVLGYRIGNVAFCTDTNQIPEASFDVLAGVEFLILDALRWTPHERIGPRQAYLTHCSHDLDYDETCAKLPAGVSLAHDGLRLPLTL